MSGFFANLAYVYFAKVVYDLKKWSEFDFCE